MKCKILFLIVLILATFGVGCGEKDDKSLDCSGLTPNYTNDIAGILTTNCALDGCHGNVGTQAGINFTTFEGAKAGSSNIKFINAIKHESGAQSMPPEGFSKLNDENIKLIECWIQNGRPL